MQNLALRYDVSKFGAVLDVSCRHVLDMEARLRLEHSHLLLVLRGKHDLLCCALRKLAALLHCLCCDERFGLSQLKGE